VLKTIGGNRPAGGKEKAIHSVGSTEEVNGEDKREKEYRFFGVTICAALREKEKRPATKSKHGEGKEKGKELGRRHVKTGAGPHILAPGPGGGDGAESKIPQLSE